MIVNDGGEAFMKKIILLGAGGHCQAVSDSICDGEYTQIVGIDLQENVGKTIKGTYIAGCDDDLLKFYEQGFRYAFITLGTIGNSIRRRYLYSELKRIGYTIPNIIDKTAIVSKQAILGDGNYIGKGAIVNAGVTIGNCCIINTRASIDHGTIISDFVNVAPGSTISGDAVVEKDTHIGTGSSVIQGIRIGENTMIGAGSVVVRDIPASVVAFGCPCKVHRPKQR